MNSMIAHRQLFRQRLAAVALLLATALPSPAYALRAEIEGTVQPGLANTLRRRNASVGLEEAISPVLRARLRTPMTPEQVQRAVEFLTKQWRSPPTAYQAEAMKLWFGSAARPGEPPVRLGAVAKILSNGQPFDEEVAKAFLIATRLWAKYGLTDKARDALITHFYWPERMTDESTISWIRETVDPGAFRSDGEARTILQEARAMHDRPALGSVEAEQRAAAQRRTSGLEESVNPNAWETVDDVLGAFPILGRGTAKQLLDVRAKLPGGQFASIQQLEGLVLKKIPVEGQVIRGIGQSTWQLMRPRLQITGQPETELIEIVGRDVSQQVDRLVRYRLYAPSELPELFKDLRAVLTGGRRVFGTFSSTRQLGVYRLAGLLGFAARLEQLGVNADQFSYDSYHLLTHSDDIHVLPTRGVEMPVDQTWSQVQTEHYQRLQEIPQAAFPVERASVLSVFGEYGGPLLQIAPLMRNSQLVLLDANPANVMRAMGLFDARQDSNTYEIKLSDVRVGFGGIPYPNNTFDVVLMLGHAEHGMSRDDLLQALTEVLRVLKVNRGRLFVETPNAERYQWALGELVQQHRDWSVDMYPLSEALFLLRKTVAPVGLEEGPIERAGFVLTGPTGQAWRAFVERGLPFLVVTDPGRAERLRGSGLEEAHLLVVEQGTPWPEALAHARARLQTAGVETIRVLTDGNLILRVTEALRGARWPAEAIDRFLEQVQAVYT